MNKHLKKTYECCKQGEWSPEKNHVICKLTKQECPVFSFFHYDFSASNCLCRDNNGNQKKAFKKFDLSIESRPMPELKTKHDDAFAIQERGVKILFDKNAEQDSWFPENNNNTEVILEFSNGKLGIYERFDSMTKACDWSIVQLQQAKADMESMLVDIDRAIDRLANGMLEGYVKMDGKEKDKLYPYYIEEDRVVVKLRHGENPHANKIQEKKDDKVS